MDRLKYLYLIVNSFLSIFRPFIAYLILSLGTLLMLSMIIEYANLQTDIHFVVVKQDYINIPWWRGSFYVHAFSSILALMAGLTQFSNHVLKNYNQLHRAVGKFYVANILLINFAVALILPIYANGGLPT